MYCCEYCESEITLHDYVVGNHITIIYNKTIDLHKKCKKVYIESFNIVYCEKCEKYFDANDKHFYNFFK